MGHGPGSGNIPLPNGMARTWRAKSGSPRHRGFGHIVIADMTARSLFGDVDYRFESEGVVWRLSAPAENVREQIDAQEPQAA